VTTRICPIPRSRRAGALVALLAAALTLQSCHTGSADTRAGANAPGRPSWSHAVHGWPSSIVTDRRGLVVLSGGAAVTDLDGGGARRWTTRVDGLTGTDPALSETQVVVAATDRMVALDRGDGSVRWHVDVPGTVGALVTAEPVGTGPVGARSTVVNSTFDGFLEGRSPADGSVRWRVHRAGEVRARLALGDRGRVVVALWSGIDDSTVGAVDVASGRMVWEQRVAPYASAPAVTHGLVVLGAGDDNYRSEVRAFALRGGAPVWAAAVPASFEPGIEPGVAGTDVVLVDHLGTATALDVRDGRVRWQRPLERAVLVERPVISDRFVIVTTAAREVVWLDRRSGRIIRRWEPGAVPAATASVRDRFVVALRQTQPGRLEAYPL
jgi:outer membrane protein assembly factor BamB